MEVPHTIDSGGDPPRRFSWRFTQREVGHTCSVAQHMRRASLKACTACFQFAYSIASNPSRLCGFHQPSRARVPEALTFRAGAS